VENREPEIERIKAVDDPLERAVEIGKLVTSLAQLQEELLRLRREAVLQLRERGYSYGEIGRALGLHRNRIQQIAEGRSR
jgi:DNA-directed RNA polymerase specialized sigma24 family protein